MTKALDSDEELPAGEFAAWLAEMQAAMRGEGIANVPCDGCTACCTASQFVHIGPDEAGTLSHIPPELLFPAPGLPPGHVVLGYDERGHCPLLADGKCSIYAHRPRTCRTYDCRIFAATGIDVDRDDSSKTLIGRQARRWKFCFRDAAAREQYEAVRSNAKATASNTAANATQRAVQVIRTADPNTTNKRTR
jgi:Fe-S-cluster containining protein